MFSDEGEWGGGERKNTFLSGLAHWILPNEIPTPSESFYQKVVHRMGKFQMDFLSKLIHFKIPLYNTFCKSFTGFVPKGNTHDI